MARIFFASGTTGARPRCLRERGVRFSALRFLPHTALRVQIARALARHTVVLLTFASKHSGETAMPSAQSGSNTFLTADFLRHFDQACEQTKAVFATQKELLDALERMNEHWFARAKSEAELATTLANKLVSARSMPDVTSVCQDWVGQRVQRYVEDSNRMLSDVQKFVRTGARTAPAGNGGA
jgi:hypothetical protein